ncbi:MAG: hypothetical protein MZU79_00125 [Anaerotruncus sp.]|nr:hypothetical protein [Anaerotruncus sp.]
MKNALHPDRPVSMGCFGMPEIYTEAQMNRETGVQGLLSAHPEGLGGVGQVSRADTTIPLRHTAQRTRTIAS